MRKEDIVDFFQAEDIVDFIRTLDEVSDDVREKMLTDSDVVKQLIPIREWVADLPLTLFVDWGVAKDFNLFMSIREFLQNAYDAAESEFGYEGIEENSGIEVGYNYIIIWNYGRDEILPVHFFFKSFKQSPKYRGRFGEGMKLAITWLIYNGCQIYIQSHDKVYKFFAVSEDSPLHVALGIADEEFNGTKVIIIASPDFVKDVSEVGEYISIFEYLKQHPDKLFFELSIQYADTTKYEHVVDTPNRIWVDDIYVTDMTVQFKVESLMSYNIWGIRLEPNRRFIDPGDEWKFRKEVAKLYDRMSIMQPEKLDKVFSAMIEPSVTSIVSAGVPVYSIKRLFETTNTHIDLSATFGVWVKEKFGEKVARIRSESLPLLSRVAYKLPSGYVLFITEDDVDIARTLPTIADVLREEVGRDYTPLNDLKQLPFELLRWYDIAIIFITHILSIYGKVPRAIIVPVEEYTDRSTLGAFYAPREGQEYAIISTISKLDISEDISSVVFEEVLHYVTYEVFGPDYSEDMTKEFESALISIIVKTNELYTHEYLDYVSKVMRYPALKLLQNYNSLVSESISEGEYEPQEFLSQLFSPPSLVSFTHFYGKERDRLQVEVDRILSTELALPESVFRTRRLKIWREVRDDFRERLNRGALYAIYLFGVRDGEPFVVAPNISLPNVDAQYKGMTLEKIVDDFIKNSGGYDIIHPVNEMFLRYEDVVYALILLYNPLKNKFEYLAFK